MPNYFVCEIGPMGGANIVFVGETRAYCDLFINQNSHRKLYLYELQVR